MQSILASVVVSVWAARSARICVHGLLPAIVLLATACGGATPSHDAARLIDQARRGWAGDWHAIWQIDWAGAPVRGALVAEIWHAADGRLRIETLEAPTPALNGLTLVDDGRHAWLVDLRLNQSCQGARETVRIPLADDMLEAMDWLLTEATDATITSFATDELESGLATRLDLTTASGAQSALWVNQRTGLPAGLALSSGVWGEVTSVTRSIEHPAHLPDALFRWDDPPTAPMDAHPRYLYRK